MELRAGARPPFNARPSIVASIIVALAANVLGALGQPSPNPPRESPWGACAESAFRSSEGTIHCDGPTGERLDALAAWLAGVPVDPAALDAPTLDLVEGVGPRLAERILKHRAGKPDFSWSALTEVRGVGPRLAERIERRLGHGRAPSRGLTRPSK